MSKAGTTVGTAIQAKMNKERTAMVAKERAKIDAADKIKFAQAEREAEEGRAFVKRETAARHEREAERAARRTHRELEEAAELEAHTKGEPKAKRVKGERKKSTAHAGYTFGRKIEDDDEFTAEMAKQLRKDPALTWAGVLVEMRKIGIAGGTKRAARLFSAAQSQAVGSKISKSNRIGRPTVKATAPKRSKKVSKRK